MLINSLISATAKVGALTHIIGQTTQNSFDWYDPVIAAGIYTIGTVADRWAQYDFHQVTKNNTNIGLNKVYSKISEKITPISKILKSNEKREEDAQWDKRLLEEDLEDEAEYTRDLNQKKAKSKRLIRNRRYLNPKSR